MDNRMIWQGEEAKLIIIRGPAGSGKSTLAKMIKKGIDAEAKQTPALTVEADDYFYIGGDGYTFDPEQLKDAHKWCRNKVAWLLRNHHTVILSNCNTFIGHLEQYLDLAEYFDARVVVYECTNDFGSIHAPAEVSARMRKNFQPLSQYPKVQKRIKNHNLYLDNVGGSKFLQGTYDEFQFAEKAKDNRVKEMRLDQ